MKLTKEFQVINIIVFILAIIYFNFTIEFNFGDDVGLRRSTLNLNTLMGLYLNWSGRVLDRILLIFMAHNPCIFRVLNSLVMIAMPVATWLLIDRSKKLSNLTLFVIMFMLYDYKEMRGAGIIATYITYYWSLLANILFYIILRRCLAANKILSLDFILAVIICIFVCNSEIGALFNAIILFALLALPYCHDRTVNRKILFLLVISILSIIFFLTCPGLHNRSVLETIRWLPDFSSYTIVYKLYLGFAETLFYYFSNKTVLLLFFLSVILVVAVHKGINVAYLMLFCITGLLFQRYAGNIIIKFSNISNPRAYVFLAVLVCFSCFILLTIRRIFKDNIKMFWLLSFILSIGLVTRLVMGFSPTLYASGTRTYMYCDFAILVSAYYILKESKTDLAESCPALLALFAYPYFISNLFPN